MRNGCKVTWLRRRNQEEQSYYRKVGHGTVEFLQVGLGHGAVEFLHTVGFPAAGNFSHLFPEREVGDFGNDYRYLDQAYICLPELKKLEIQGFGPLVRVRSGCPAVQGLMGRHCLLSLNGWTFLPVAYPSIVDESKQRQQLVLAFIGKFIASDVPSTLSWLEAETVSAVCYGLSPPWSWPAILECVTGKPDASCIIRLICK